MLLTSFAIKFGLKWAAKKGLVALFHAIGDGYLDFLAPLVGRALVDKATSAAEGAIEDGVEKIAERLARDPSLDLKDAFEKLARATDEELEGLIADLTACVTAAEGESTAVVDSRRAMLANYYRTFVANERAARLAATPDASAAKTLDTGPVTIPARHLPRTKEDWLELLPHTLPSGRAPASPLIPA